jgi:hypothetical protein
MKNSSQRRKASALSLSRLRSSISNGSQLLADLDHRSAWARRLKDLIGDVTSDLGGPEAISEAQKILVRRAAMLCLQLELQEQRFAQNGGEAGSKAIESYQRCTNTLRRVLESLGLQRRPRDVSPSTLRPRDLNRLIDAVRVSP